MSAWIFVLAAIAAGVATVTQSGMNSTLARFTGTAFNAATVSLCLSALVMLALQPVMKDAFNWSGALRQGPWWMWLGGLCGVVFVTAVAFSAPRVGAVGVVSCILAGQLVAALIYDRFGLLGFGAQEISWQRLLGVALVVGGMVLILYSNRTAA